MRIVRQPHRRRHGSFSRVASSTFADDFADYAQRVAYSDAELLASLQNTLTLHEHEVREASTLFGQFIGLFAKRIDPEHVTIDGTRLRHLLGLAELDSPQAIAPGGTYNIDLPSFRELLEKASQHSRLRS